MGQASYYVAPTGSDANPGTESAPFQTITKARDVVRTIAANMTGDIYVDLRGGTYGIGSTIAFGPRTPEPTDIESSIKATPVKRLS